ncbi:tetratricopeptide repeat protein [Sulfitobacter aestuarii]|uniref:Tetratricopeptide repeat protein n=1 Tax=Sulfitobacter aestuarii TaxID=2161676 RepID=A0ABW5TZ70_9RHOB
MRPELVNLKHIVAALALASVLAAAGAPLRAAAEPAPPELFAELAVADEDEAPGIARQIESLWRRSGSATMDLLLKRGQDALDSEQVPEAIEHLTALTDHAPDFAEGYHLRAQAFFRRGLVGPALADLEMTLSLNPQHYHAIFGLAVMLQETGDTPAAEQLYRRVLAIHPHHRNALDALDALQRDGIGRTL